MQIVKDEVYNWHEQNECDQVGSHGPASSTHQSLPVQAFEGIRGHMRSEAPHREIRETEENQYTE